LGHGKNYAVGAWWELCNWGMVGRVLVGQRAGSVKRGRKGHYQDSRDEINLERRWETYLCLDRAREYSDSVMNSNLRDRVNWDSSSLQDPNAILRNLRNSFLVPLPWPSATFSGMETAALFICSTRP